MKVTRGWSHEEGDEKKKESSPTVPPAKLSTDDEEEEEEEETEVVDLVFRFCGFVNVTSSSLSSSAS